MAYADLLAEVADTMDRDDLSTRLPRWLRRVEARVNKLLDDPEMEVSTTLTGDGADLPADFGSMVSIGTADGNVLSPITDTEFSATLPRSGVARFYTIREGKVYYAGGSANPTLVYRANVPALTEAAPTNWLLERGYDVYLYGALAYASEWERDEAAASAYNNLFDRAIGELRQDAARRKYGAGVLAPRIRRA